jgi:hypothetical protein
VFNGFFIPVHKLLEGAEFYFIFNRVELAVQTRLAFNSKYSDLILFGTGIIAMYHQACFY